MGAILIGPLIQSIGKVADDLFTSDEERLKASIDEKTIDASLAKGQMEVNQEEAQNTNLFVSGWRPSIGWIGAVALAYQFVIYPLLVWVTTLSKAHGWLDAGFEPPPVLNAEALFAMVTGMLGIAGLRSYDKAKGTASNR